MAASFDDDFIVVKVNLLKKGRPVGWTVYILFLRGGTPLFVEISLVNVSHLYSQQLRDATWVKKYMIVLTCATYSMARRSEHRTVDHEGRGSVHLLLFRNLGNFVHPT